MNIPAGVGRLFNAMRIALGVTMAGALVILAACSPAPTPPASSSPSQPASLAPADAQLTVTASGRISCMIPYGCGALLVIQPNPAGASPLPVWTISSGQQISFPSIGTSAMGTWDVGAIPNEAPSRIEPGRYNVAGVVNMISDVPSPVTTPVPIEVVPTCVRDMTVVAGTNVTIAVKFGAPGGCTIAIAAVAEATTPSLRPLGSVPPGSMTVSVSNGTTLAVNVFVNGSFIAYLGPGGCAGCRGDDGIPARILPPLPWHVEVRMPAGRFLVALDIHAGDVVYTSGGAKGDGNLVELSCGRIDIWSGPPIGGPSPGPGTPGDCRP